MPRLAWTQRAPREPGGHRRALRVVAVAGAVLLIAIAWFLLSLFQPLKGDGEGKVRVVVPEGAGVGEIGDILERRGVVSSAFFFELRARMAGRSGDLRPGVYQLPKDASYGYALDTLTAGVPDDVVSVTIPEGRSRGEVGPIVAKAGLDGSYARATARSRLLDPADYGAERARNLEGFLFPASYELKRGATARTLVTEQLTAFKREFRKVSLRKARRKNLTAYDVLIIASMVEREAQLDKERPLVASVIYNRLRRGEPLGIDATIRFATNNWVKPLRQSELALDSAYNTRTRQGLPPGPIGSPGLASIRAAANPASSRYLFYVVKPTTCGEHAFSTTLEQFERDSRRYNAEREKRGGRSPTDC
jgi:UPF0755 protein